MSEPFKGCFIHYSKNGLLSKDAILKRYQQALDATRQEIVAGGSSDHLKELFALKPTLDETSNDVFRTMEYYSWDLINTGDMVCPTFILDNGVMYQIQMYSAVDSYTQYFFITSFKK